MNLVTTPKGKNVLSCLTKYCFVCLFLLTFFSTKDLLAQCSVQLTIINQGSCTTELYHWLPTGDIFIGNIAPGASYTVYTEDHEMWRTKIGPWSALEFDASYTVEGCQNQTFTIQPCGAFEMLPPACNLNCSGVNNNINGFEFLGEFNGHVYYKKLNGDVTYTDATAYANNLGGYLATISSQAENDWLRNVTGTGNFWIGLSDASSEGSWLWANGEPVTYTNWSGNEPNDSNGEDYAHVRGNGEWNDVPATHVNWAVIEVDCPCDNVPPMLPQPVCNLDVEMGDSRDICAGESITLTAGVNNANDCSCCYREVANTINCNNDNTYGFYLKETEGPAVHFTLTSASFEECSNGTARYMGMAVGNNGDEVTFDILFEGATTTPPDADSPKGNNCGEVNTADWVYYPTTTGSFTSAQHGEFTITRRGASFQLGDGANSTSLGFGASGWFEITNGNGFYSIGDVNFMLGALACPDNNGGNTSYSWSTGETTQSITVDPTSTTTYSVTVTDCEGCTATDEITVNVSNLAVAADASGAQSICAGQDINISANVSNQSDCSDITNLYRIVNSDPICAFGDNGPGVFFQRGEGCQGLHTPWTAGEDLYLTEYADGTATITGSVHNGGQTGVVELLLFGQSNTGMNFEGACYADNLGAISYYYTGFYGTITIGGQVLTIEPKENGKDFILANGAGNDGSGLGLGGWTGGTFGECSELVMNLNPVDLPSNNTAITYEWTGPNGFTSSQPNITVNATGTYSIKVTDCAGCMATDEITINENNPTATASNNGPLSCNQPTVQLNTETNLTGDGISYSWTGPNGFTSTMQSPSVTEAGTYEVTISQNGCSATASTTVLESEEGCEYDLALIKILAPNQPSTVQIGDNVNFIIKVTNQGAVNSGDYSVMDRLPSELTFVSAGQGGIHNNGQINWDLSDLAPGDFIELELTVNVAALGTGKHVNWAEISSDSGDDDDSTPDGNTGIGFTNPNDLVENHNDMMLDNSPNDEDDNDFEEILVDRGVNLLTRVMLQGARMSTTDGLMNDLLRQDDLIPDVEPYSGMTNYEHVGLGGGETVDASVLEVEGENAIVDWMFIQIRDKDNPAQVVATTAALLQRDGDIVATDGVSPLSFPTLQEEDYYHIAVRHRNHLGTMTQLPVYLNKNAPTESERVDFTEIATYGLNAQFVDNTGEQCLWAGDTNGNGTVIFQGQGSGVNQAFFEVLLSPENADAQPNFILNGYNMGDVNVDCQTIYQGVNNEPTYLFFNVVQHPANLGSITNYVISEKLP